MTFTIGVWTQTVDRPMDEPTIVLRIVGDQGLVNLAIEQILWSFDFRLIIREKLIEKYAKNPNLKKKKYRVFKTLDSRAISTIILNSWFFELGFYINKLFFENLAKANLYMKAKQLVALVELYTITHCRLDYYRKPKNLVMCSEVLQWAVSPKKSIKLNTILHDSVPSFKG